MVTLLALNLEANGKANKARISKAYSLIAMIVCITHLLSFLSGHDFSHMFMFFESTVDKDVLLGKNNSMGLNTTLMLLLLSLSSLFYMFKFSHYSQLLSFTALCIPMVSITGYAYGLTSFYGAMSLLSTTFGVFLCVGMLAITANKGGVRAILSPYIGGKIARIQIVLGYFVPLLIGYLVVRSLMNSDQNSVFGIYVVAICWFIALLVVVSAIVQEKVDGKRREVEKALQLSAMTDELTQLPNRRFFMKAAIEKLDADAVFKSALNSWFLMIDIDHFKKINDTAGHEMGDRVLVEFGKVLKKFVGPKNLVCRLGGEEFSFLLSCMTKAEVETITDNILKAVSAMNIPGYTDIHGPITTSIGCAPSNGSANIDQALRFADEALYLSKNTGRNRVMFTS